MTLMLIGLLIIGVAVVLCFVGTGSRQPDVPGGPEGGPPTGPEEGAPPDPGDPAQPYAPDETSYQQYGHPPPGAVTFRVTYQKPYSPMSIASLAMVGVAVLGWRWLNFEILAIPVLVAAIVCGHQGIRETARGHKGRWMAVTGLVLGYVLLIIALSFYALILMFVGVFVAA